MEHHFALRARDDAGLWSRWSNTARAVPHDSRPRIALEPDSLDFGDVRLGEERHLRIVIRSIGGSTFDGTLFHPSCVAFHLERGEIEIRLEPGRTLTEWIRFRPSRAGAVRCRWAVMGARLIPLSGAGVRVGVPGGMAAIAPGSFAMGSPPEEPGRDPWERQHEVTLTRGFLLGDHEVTQAEWTEIMG